MNKFNYKGLLSIIIALSIVFSTDISALAKTPQISSNITKEYANNSTVVVTDDGVYIKGQYYSKTEFIKLLNMSTTISLNNKTIPSTSKGIIPPNTTPAAAAVYFVPGIGEFALAATGVIIVGGVAIAAGSWLADVISNWIKNSSSTDRKIAQIRAKIPSKLLDDDGNVDLGKFNQKVKNKTAYKEKGGWTIDKDNAGHGGRKWKLKNKSGDRVASLGENGEILGD